MGPSSFWVGNSTQSLGESIGRKDEVFESRQRVGFSQAPDWPLK